MNKNEIIESIYTNKLLNEAIDNIVIFKRYREDFKSHFILQIMNIKEERLIGLYNRREIDWFCLRVMTNQWKSKTSTFWKIYRNNGFGNDNILQYTDDVYGELKEEEKEEENNIFTKTESEIEKEVKKILMNQYDEFLINQYHKKLFEMRHFDKMTIKQISEKTDIHYRAVLRSIHKTEKYIKNKIIK